MRRRASRTSAGELVDLGRQLLVAVAELAALLDGGVVGPALDLGQLLDAGAGGLVLGQVARWRASRSTTRSRASRSDGSAAGRARRARRRARRGSGARRAWPVTVARRWRWPGGVGYRRSPSWRASRWPSSSSATATSKPCEGVSFTAEAGAVTVLLGPERRRQDHDRGDHRGLPAARRRHGAGARARPGRRRRRRCGPGSG